MCAGRLPQAGDDLASQLTMSRLENQASRTDLFRMGNKLLDNFIDSYSREPKVIILDCDDTNTNTHGQQELICLTIIMTSIAICPFIFMKVSLEN